MYTNTERRLIMKNKVFALFLLLSVSLFAFAGCADTPANKDYSDYKTINIDTDRAIYSGLDELLYASDIVVLGKFCSDTEQELFYEYSDEYGKDTLVDAVSTNYISVSKVLYGDSDASQIKVSQRYGVLDERKEIITFSSMLPMKKNDEWIFFLYYDKDNDTYWCTGDYCGRMPVYNDKIKDETQKYIQYQKDLDELLQRNKNISNDEIEKYNEEGSIVFFDSQAKAYILSDDDANKAAPILEGMESVRSKIDPATFGVYSTDEINLDLYTKVIGHFKLDQA